MILVGGVGYPDLRDLSFGPHLIQRLREDSWGDAVVIEDLSFGPIAVVQWLEDSPGRYDRALFAGAVERGNPPGTLTHYRWPGEPLAAEEVQARVAEGVTGVISVDNLVIIAQYFGVLPADTSVIELEPVELEWGADMSELGSHRLTEALAWVRREIESDGSHRERVAP